MIKTIIIINSIRTVNIVVAEKVIIVKLKTQKRKNKNGFDKLAKSADVIVLEKKRTEQKYNAMQKEERRIILIIMARVIHLN